MGGNSEAALRFSTDGPSSRRAGKIADSLRASGDIRAARALPGPSPVENPLNSIDRKSQPPKVGMVSLGCPKALVDSEQ
ncbi:MAG TPA: hypothetical protein VGG24_06000, partial [Paraburkholderia sp.]